MMNKLIAALRFVGFPDHHILTGYDVKFMYKVKNKHRWTHEICVWARTTILTLNMHHKWWNTKDIWVKSLHHEHFNGLDNCLTTHRTFFKTTRTVGTTTDMATYKEDHIALKNIITYFKYVLPPFYTITHSITSNTVSYHTTPQTTPHRTTQQHITPYNTIPQNTMENAKLHITLDWPHHMILQYIHKLPLLPCISHTDSPRELQWTPTAEH